jgi:hypothetical protein
MQRPYTVARTVKPVALREQHRSVELDFCFVQSHMQLLAPHCSLRGMQRSHSTRAPANARVRRGGVDGDVRLDGAREPRCR